MTRCRKWQGRELCVGFMVGQQLTRYQVRLDGVPIGQVQEQQTDTVGRFSTRSAFAPMPVDRGYMMPERTLQKATTALAERAVRLKTDRRN